MKNIYIFSGILLLLFFNICFFVFLYPNITVYRWLTYIFITLSIIIYASSGFLIKTKDYVLNLSEISIILGYLFSELLCGSLLLFLNFEKWSFIIQIFMLFLFMGIFVINRKTNRHTEKDILNSKATVNAHKNLLCRFELLYTEASSNQEKSILNNIIEEIKTSPVNNNPDQDLERQIINQLDKLEVKSTANQSDNPVQILTQILTLVKRRKQLLRTSYEL